MSKSSISGRLVLAFVVATLAGACLHFLYDLLPNPLTALFSPIVESIWEHLKIIYWPYLLGMVLATGKAGRGNRANWLFSLIVISVTMLVATYVYHISLGGDNSTFDIALYVLLMALGFWLPSRLSPNAGRSTPVFFLVVLLGFCIVLFTFLPPDNILFADLSSVHTWYTIPC